MSDNDSKPLLLLAPMEGVTDVVMRDKISSLGGVDFCISEFIRVTSMVPPVKVFQRSMPEINHDWKTPAGTQVIPQLLGGDAKIVAESAKTLRDLGAPGIDLNFGCPAKTVNRHDGGASILKDPARLEVIVNTTIKAVAPLPVSIKIRLGWEDPNEIKHLVSYINNTDGRWLTIHGRTRMEGYAPPAHWNLIAFANKHVRMPVVANGDIFTLADYKKCLSETGCGMAMIGRGILKDPFLIRKISKNDDSVSTEDALKFCLDFIRSYRATYGPSHPGVGRLKQLLKYLAPYHKVIEELFENIKRQTVDDEFIHALNNALDNYSSVP